PISEGLGNDTLDQAQNVGSAGVASRIEIVGTIGNAATGAADVDFYRFQLDRAANVIVATPNAGPTTPSIAAISLYNSAGNNPNDPYTPLGDRLLAQDDSALHADGARIERRLAAGTYYVAVSGSGNRYFHPFLAGSGVPGSTGDYGLLITTTDLGLNTTDGPMVLASD